MPKQAFPRPSSRIGGMGCQAQPGMTLHEYYVGQALVGLSPHIIGSKYPASTSTLIADWAIKIATATMKQLDKK